MRGVLGRRRWSATLWLCTALDAVGAAARLLDMTVTYAGQRQQFGPAIGTFQAVKHHCATMARRSGGKPRKIVGGDRSAGYRPPGRGPDPGGRRGLRVCQGWRVFGGRFGPADPWGIGFTWEHDLHLFLRRIKVDEAMNGTGADHCRVLVDR